TGADVDGDGHLDYVANAMHGNGANGNLAHAGNVYIFSGRKLSARLGLLPDVPVLAGAALSANGVAVNQAPAGQSGLTVTVAGSGLRADTRFTINGGVVGSQAATTSGASQQVVISLDDNPDVRNTAGPIVVQAQNTSPSSGLSNSVTAGTLT